MRLYACVLVTFASLIAVTAEDRNHKKRQIYREEVLPHAGGKIPDTAFETDRLFLNRLQKEGISVPDGIVPEQRDPQVYPFYNKPSRTVYRVALSSDARFTPKEGRYIYDEVPSIETTYLYPQIHGQQITLTPPTPPAAYPVYRKFQLHNPQLNQLKLQPKKKAQFLDVTPNNSKNRLKSYKTQSYQNFNILNDPIIKPSTSDNAKNHHNLPNYGNSHIFNEFDDLFNNFDLHQTGRTYYQKPSGHPTGHLIY